MLNTTELIGAEIFPMRKRTTWKEVAGWTITFIFAAAFIAGLYLIAAADYAAR